MLKVNLVLLGTFLSLCHECKCIKLRVWVNCRGHVVTDRLEMLGTRVRVLVEYDEKVGRHSKG